jgi:glycosyltransferase involved in cell wall biosynthesis
MNENQSDVFSLDSRYSTTRIVTKEQPRIENSQSSKVQMKLFLPAHPKRQGEGGLRTKGYFKKSFNDKPLVSVITVVFNRHEYLEQTIQSVLNQTYDNVEYIVIDGGSTDGTIDIIRKYEQAIDYWVSEPDSGIADAWNKGIPASTGDIIGLINSDDWYELNAVADVVGLLTQNRAAGVIHGNRRQWNELGTKVLGISRPVTHIEKAPPFRTPVNHPTCFVRRQIYQTYGLFDKNYRVAMDYEFILRLCRHKVYFLYLNTVITNMRTGGLSCGLTGIREARDIIIRNGGKINRVRFYYYKEMLKNRCVLIADMLKVKGVLRYCYWKLTRR